MYEMALRKNSKKQSTTPLPEFSFDEELSFRIQKISEQTGLSYLDLFRKWLFQEECSVAIIRSYEESILAEVEEKFEKRFNTLQKNLHKELKTKSMDTTEAVNAIDREKLPQEIKRLKEAGMTYVQIAEHFNNEKIPTSSGTGKWHAASISRLLR
jgi:hypothetical protein